MGKLFFEAFSTLKLNHDLQSLMEEVEITKISSNTKRDFIRVYIKSSRLIEKKDIFGIEREIRNQLFPKNEISIKILESFHLSEQYTPSKLMVVYRDSILDELKEYSMLEYNLFHMAKYKFVNEEVLIITLEDSVIAKSKADELVRILDKIFNERCGFKIKIDVEYEEPKSSKARAMSEKKIEQEIAFIVSQCSIKRDDEEYSQNIEEQSTNADSAVAEKETKIEKPIQKQKETKPSFEKKSYQKGGYGQFKKSDNPDVIYGRDFEEGEITIESIAGEMGEVVIRGKVIFLDTREIRNEKTIVMFNITDFTDTITVKMFLKNEQRDELLKELKTGVFIKVKGITTVDRFDSELTIASVAGMKKIPDFTTSRMDTNPEKRVELHCHTKMSDMDGVADVKDIIKRAKKWGHKAIAITDHGVVQAFTDANHAIDKNDDFKVIYGVEAYLVDDLKEIVQNVKGQTLNDTFVVFDIETTGFSPIKNRIIEIGAVKVKNGEIIERFSSFVNPQVPIPFEIEKLTGITDNMVINEPLIDEVLPKFIEFCNGAVMVAHNAGFDMSFIKANCDRQKLICDYTVIDTVAMARFLLPSLSKYKLDVVAKSLGISLDNHHRAVDDAGCTAEIFVKFIEMLKEREIYDLHSVNQAGGMSVQTIKKLPTHHAIILAKNDVGRVNLYKLISYSHINYYSRRPRIPKSEFIKYREGLIIGSACEAGELYKAVLRGESEEEIARLVNFYDYLEIQPIGNNSFMLKDEKNSQVNSEDDLKNINRKIVELGEQFKKPVVATCDVHFLDPEDEVYRRIIMAGKGFKDADDQAPLYLRTTEEMLKEFEYLGSKKAEEVVITNTNKIADMIERISPVRPDKCAPVIENSDQTLRDICYDKAHEIYGKVLPEVVTERLERELNSIISNGFAVMYIIAQKLVWKSNDDGYLVGSRGSVGSSFVATMSGITEVNPLRPHYYCAKCHYSDFDSEEVKKYVGGAGCDMPDKPCPKCGELLKKEGFDIPFETFLGFKGNKEPDIDLNFSGDYQSNAHRYTEVIFGKGQTFRAGTIGTLADKTAFGYVKNYYEERGVRKRNCEISRIVGGCVGVRRTTGQHPGGIIVLPHGEEIYSFTPVQRPANDMTTDTITTHFDYHSIDHNLLKLDILGHDDPTMIRMLEDITGIDAKEIPLDNKEVMSLFSSTKALNITPDDIGGCPLGALGIPEFGTDFVIQMLIDTKPKSFSDLVRISGLSHGTDVWLGNAQTLIQEKKATISTAICTRDDIMTYLINQGVESELSFTIMESVRKGKGLKDEWVDAMLEKGVPEWYIWSCRKIKYMFPKAHAAAYVMMAWRIAYFKVFYPLAYYAAYFSIRASGFTYELMCQGKDKLEYYLNDYKKRADTLSKKEQDTLKDMRIVQEMYARGFEFEPINIYSAKAHRFEVVNGKLMPSLSTIDGLGDKAADAVVEAAKDGKFLSKDDFRQRTKVSKTVIDLMDDLGLLGDLPESNQLSLFDM
ncbi:PolC-type DNA polymerase III [Candidatus Galacturonibacter soehngenii]|uniref:DNA polymerase III PolC-type n=1 Tax=Candidatus Galacturonatibacter soehngenii TaxID=2307010 RepID=A0A7V7QJ81_9FIRM|nr:PolC-type DNA polymerase III [Candidatus Galacturonibacter soehngenii]KAB1437667.1 PolC-type DNA polymerase III [Candidatus Galacturonibacter soehngenii]MBA4686895.1 PolC-type DNA polymerase III [Candidatus Galacturonibacter soehngenii]